MAQGALATLVFASTFATTGNSASAYDDPLAITHNTFGEVGFMDMPSARMSEDGALGFTYGRVAGSQRYTVWFQALPWLDTSFRYSRVVPGWYDRSFGLKVRLVREGSLIPEISVGTRDLLGTGLYGSEYVVANKKIGAFDVSMGMGWGRLADTNTISNPFGFIQSSFNTRSQPSLIGPGTLNTKTFFHGAKVGLFGAVSWETPVEGLLLEAEISSDKYKFESGWPGTITIRSPANFALSYQISSAISTSVGWLYGTTYGVAITIASNAKTETPSALRIGPKIPKSAIRSISDQQAALVQLGEYRKTSTTPRSGRFPAQGDLIRQELLQIFLSEARGVRDVDIQGKTLIIDAHISTTPQQQCAEFARLASNSASTMELVLNDTHVDDGRTYICALPANKRPVTIALTATPGDKAFEDRVKSGLSSQMLALSGFAVGTGEIWVYYDNYHYRLASEAAGRVVRVLMTAAPSGVEIFHLIPTNLGLPQQEITIYRSSLERAQNGVSQDEILHNVIRVRSAQMESPGLDRFASTRYPIFNASFDPKLTQHLFDPDQPLQFMIYGDIAALLQIAPGLSLSGQFTGTIWSDYSFTRPAGSDLPHVRSDVLQYLKHGKYGIADLQLSYRARLSPTIFTEVRAGLLEDMFAGFGGQILWRPEESRWALGGNLYQVWQREYHRLFGMQNYNVFTGHISLYYRSPWYGLNYAVHAGRYLAGDDGATFEITRRFSSGVEIGAWATFTNVPFSKFGEGSFDKGIIIHIPFEWGLPISSQSAYDLRLNSLTRDGGQRLGGDDGLYNATLDASYREIAEHANEIVEP